MALFVFWRGSGAGGPGGAVRGRIAAEAHIVPEVATAADFATAGGRWHLSAFATASRFHEAREQVWIGEREACVIHGLIWRMQDGGARLLDAAAVARLIARPGDRLPADVAGEFAVARLHPCGTLTAFSDRAGLQPLFHGPASLPAVANRAGLIAALIDDWSADPGMLAWLPTIGYRLGRRTAYRAIRSVAQETVLLLRNGTIAREPMGEPVIDFARPRGFASIGAGELEAGIEQAMAAVRLAAGADGPVDLPITGGKDSRVILALCLAAGLRDRLRPFTRGYEGHPDVIAGRGVAAALGLPHRREPPHGSDRPASWTGRRFLQTLMVQAYQTDGLIGGWDLILGDRIAAETALTGHMGEVVKAYSKKPVPPGMPDPIAMVRLQAPFDPLGLLRPGARMRLSDQIARQMRRALDDGARPADLPDIFYYRNRIPNWLGTVRAAKSFEKQPVAPLGVPALMRLAFRLLPEERKSERLHYHLIKATAPELLTLPFALQRWDPALGPGVPQAEPIGPAAGAPPVFGNWQYSVNSNPAVRQAIAGIICAHPGLSLWEFIDPEAALERLRNRRFDYFDGISLLGLVAALLQETGLVQPCTIGRDGVDCPWGGAAPAPGGGKGGRPLNPAAAALLEDDGPVARPRPAGTPEAADRAGPASSSAIAEDGSERIGRPPGRPGRWPFQRRRVTYRDGKPPLMRRGHE